MTRAELAAFYARSPALSETEALAVMNNPNCTAAICQGIALTSRLTSYYSIRARLVSHKATPHTFALKFVHYLYWVDLLRFSTDVRVPGPVRRSIENQLLAKLQELALGERITAAKACSREVAKSLLFDPNPLVFASLLINPRLKEEDLLFLISSGRARPHQLTAIGSDRKWSWRYAIRRALVLSASTPRSVAASQLRFLSRRDLEAIAGRRETSVYLRRCIDQLRENARAEGGKRLLAGGDDEN